MIKTRTYILTAAALAAALTLSACASGTADTNGAGGSESTSAPSASAGNASDVTFAQMMIPHHEQAVGMSEEFLAKDDADQRIVDLATQIKAAQEPEIKQLKTWLSAWGADEAMSGMDDGATGMMSDGDMMALEEASGAEADRLFLEQMMLHHEGAIEMAQTELDAGENGDAKAMAQNIVTSQASEIQTMKDLLATL